MTRLLVYAGPNGSGKSSLRDQGARVDAVQVVIDPDRIARSMNPLAPREADRAVGQEALRMFAAALAARQAMLAKLPEAISIVNRAVLTDNSGETPRPVMEVVEGRIVTVVPDLPGWL